MPWRSVFGNREVKRTHTDFFEERNLLTFCGDVSLVREGVTGLHVGWYSTIGVVHTRDGVPCKVILEHSKCINC